MTAVSILLLAMVALWRYSPLAELTDPRTLMQQLHAFGNDSWMPLVLLAAYLFGSLVVFPVTVLIAMTGLMFAPLPAFGYALGASLASAALTYGIGRAVGAQPLRVVAGPRINRAIRALSRRGVIAVAALRMLPIAPFTFINLAAGASQVRFSDYMAGTFLGMAPGILVICLLGNQLGQVLSDPEPRQLTIFGLLVLGWLGLSLAMQRLASRLRARGNA